MTQTDRLEPGQRVAHGAADNAFESILFVRAGPDVSGAPEPACFRDLNLDQVVEAIVAGRDEYDLRPFFHTPLHDVAEVEYRQAVFRDLERADVAAAVRVFGAEMRRMRQFLALAEKQRYKQEKERWFIDAAAVYCDGVSALRDSLAELDPRSRGVQAPSGYLAAYTRSERFEPLAADVRIVLDGLGRVRYTVRIKGARVTVRRYEGERDYSAEVEETFVRFRQGAAEDHPVTVPDPGSMDDVEARIVERVARLYPDEFRALDEFCVRHRDFVDPRVARFDREVQFYLAYLEHADRVGAAGVVFAYPGVSTQSKESSVEGGCDLALAAKLALEGERVVPNDFFLRKAERVLVVTGPNQGGKTTFARMFGQLHYLASLGALVPARSAQLFLPDRVFAHFEREEDIRTLRGKLDDELVRIREILEQATADSVVVLNEAFASATLADSVDVGIEVLQRLVGLDCLAVWVTFIDELASFGEATASMVAGVHSDDPSRRTFELVRRPADGRAYAWALAEKYGLSYERLRARIGR